MGYATNGLRQGFTGTGTQFFPISGEGISLSDITVKSEDLSNISIQLLSPGGVDIENITWDEWSYDEPCWVDKDGNPSTLVVKPGDGLWIQGADGDAIQTAGEVGQEDIIATWDAAGFKLVANSFPVPVSINDLVFVTEDRSNISIQVLSSGGVDIENITWDEWSFDEPCWVDKDGNVATLTVQPGQALWIQGAVGDSLRIPAPEL